MNVKTKIKYLRNPGFQEITVRKVPELDDICIYWDPLLLQKQVYDTKTGYLVASYGRISDQKVIERLTKEIMISGKSYYDKLQETRKTDDYYQKLKKAYEEHLERKNEE